MKSSNLIEFVREETKVLENQRTLDRIGFSPEPNYLEKERQMISDYRKKLCAFLEKPSENFIGVHQHSYFLSHLTLTDENAHIFAIHIIHLLSNFDMIPQIFDIIQNSFSTIIFHYLIQENLINKLEEIFQTLIPSCRESPLFDQILSLLISIISESTERKAKTIIFSKTFFHSILNVIQNDINFDIFTKEVDFLKVSAPFFTPELYDSALIQFFFSSLYSDDKIVLKHSFYLGKQLFEIIASSSNNFIENDTLIIDIYKIIMKFSIAQNLEEQEIVKSGLCLFNEILKISIFGTMALMDYIADDNIILSLINLGLQNRIYANQIMFCFAIFSSWGYEQTHFILLVCRNEVEILIQYILEQGTIIDKFHAALFISHIIMNEHFEEISPFLNEQSYELFIELLSMENDEIAKPLLDSFLKGLKQKETEFSDEPVNSLVHFLSTQDFNDIFETFANSGCAEISALAAQIISFLTHSNNE